MPRWMLPIAAMLCTLMFSLNASAGVCNLRIVTDASPDYTDMDSLIHSVTSRWDSTPDKLYAMYWWNHIARRQCTPMGLHGLELTDPVMQFNDYGYTMCSTISGVNTSIWANMGLNVHFWDIAAHTVPEVQYDGAWHMYDDSMSVLITTCDGKRIAGVEEIAAEGSCEASGGKKEKWHLAYYHNLFTNMSGETGEKVPDGCLTGAEGAGRPIKGYAACFRSVQPGGQVWYVNYWDWGHRYQLNIRPNEVYTRLWTRLDGPYPYGRTEGELFKDDPKYYIEVPITKDQGPKEKDLEFSARAYHIRGTGVWDYAPALTAEGVKQIHSVSNVAASPSGLSPAKAGEPAEAVFRVQSANVTTSQEIMADFARKNADDTVKILISADNGLHWTELWTASGTGDIKATVEPIKEINGTYEVLVKVQMLARTAPTDVVLKSIHIRTFTQINSKTQPRLNIGKNVVYLDAGSTGSPQGGDAAETTTIWPDLRAGQFEKLATEATNLATDKDFCGYGPVIFPADMEKEAVLTYKLEAPRDIVRVTIGARYRNLDDGTRGKITFLYSLDAGKTWTRAWQLGGTACPKAKGKYGSPTDAIHYETVAIPKGNKSVLVKYSLDRFGLYALRTSADFVPAQEGFKPLEVTFTWNERQDDYKLVKRSHTQLVQKLPCKYEINVGGADHPEMVSLSVNEAGSAAIASTQPVKYGYSDGKDNASARKYVGTWVTQGKNIATGKKYKFDKPCANMGGSVDPNFTRLTDGYLGAPSNYGWELSAGWAGENPTIDLDLGKEETCAALGVNIHAQESLTGEMAKENKVEILVSTDGKEFKSLGLINFKSRFKDIPYNFMLNDSEGMAGGKFLIVPEKPVKARYVRYKVTQLLNHWAFYDELLVLDKYEVKPFDIKIALPDEKLPAKRK